MSERLDPEDLQNLVKAYQQCCGQIIQQFGGYIARYMGDGILVYFGYPKAHENDASRAVQSALEIAKAVPNIKTPRVENLEVRIGIATGDVVVGDIIGEGAAEESAVLGLTPNLAARLQGAAEANSVVVSDATHRRLAGRFKAQDLGGLQLKGIRENTQAWHVTGIIDNISSPLTGAGAATPFVGRKNVFLRLQTDYNQAAKGRFTIHHISGGAGMGKTRLTVEFANQQKNTNCTMWRCSAFHTNSPLYPVPDDFIGESNGLQNTGENRRQATFDSISKMVQHKCKTAPFMLIIDDGQWLDPTTFELLLLMRQKLKQLPVMLIIASRLGDRADEIADVLGGSRSQLTALSDLETENLIDALIGVKATKEIRNRILSRAGGLPLFVEELSVNVQAKRQQEIPTSLQETLLAKLDGLGDEKRLAQLASVIGLHFTDQDLQRITETEAMQRAVQLSGLLDAGFLGVQNGVYHFRHALMHEVAYGTLLKSTRRHVHGELADSLMADDDPTVTQAIARHLSKAERFSDAQPYWLKAARDLARIWSHAEAAVCFDAALEHLDAVTDDKQVLTARLDLVESLRILERPEQALNELNRAEALIKSSGDDHDWLRLYVLRGNILFPMGDVAGCEQSQLAASKVARRLNDPAAEAKALSGLADAHFVAGKMNMAEHAYDQAVCLAEQNNVPGIVLANVSLRGHMRLYQCQINDAKTDCENAVRWAVDAGNRRAEMTARGSCLGKVLLDAGLFSAAIREFTSAQKIAHDLGAHRYEALNMLFHGKALLDTGAQSEAYGLAETAVSLSKTISEKFCLPMALGVLARAEISADKCGQILENGEKLITNGALAHNALWFYRDAGLAAIHHGWPDRARYYSQQLQNYFSHDPLPWVDLIAGGIVALADNLETGDRTLVDNAVTNAQNLDFHGWAAVLENNIA